MKKIYLIDDIIKAKDIIEYFNNNTEEAVIKFDSNSESIPKDENGDITEGSFHFQIIWSSDD